MVKSLFIDGNKLFIPWICLKSDGSIYRGGVVGLQFPEIILNISVFCFQSYQLLVSLEI
jgi:hypothetical protein